LTTTDLNRYQDRLAMFGDYGDLCRGLLEVAAELAPNLIDAGTGLDPWRSLGLRVVRRDLAKVRGILRRTADGPVIAVRASDHPRIQRFTVAHELGHVLMERVDRVQVGLSGHREEELCEKFASHLLVPRVELVPALASVEDDPDRLLELLNHFEVSISALLGAAAEPLAKRNVLAFAASRRPHPKRPDEIAYRLYGIRCGDYLMPQDTPLTSLGLTALDYSLEAGRQCVAGDEASVSLRLWRPGSTDRRSGTAVGPASWRAHRLGQVAVVCLNTPALLQRWSTARAPV
jgi:Zn-dependent peptidase ImmA (M78 family)